MATSWALVAIKNDTKKTSAKKNVATQSDGNIWPMEPHSRGPFFRPEQQRRPFLPLHPSLSLADLPKRHDHVSPAETVSIRVSSATWSPKLSEPKTTIAGMWAVTASSADTLELLRTHASVADWRRSVQIATSIVMNRQFTCASDLHPGRFKSSLLPKFDGNRPDGHHSNRYRDMR
jgi:hypothetical protein